VGEVTVGDLMIQFEQRLEKLPPEAKERYIIDCMEGLKRLVEQGWQQNDRRVIFAANQLARLLQNDERFRRAIVIVKHALIPTYRRDYSELIALLLSGRRVFKPTDPRPSYLGQLEELRKLIEDAKALLEGGGEGRQEALGKLQEALGLLDALERML